MGLTLKRGLWASCASLPRTGGTGSREASASLVLAWLLQLTQGYCYGAATWPLWLLRFPRQRARISSPRVPSVGPAQWEGSSCGPAPQAPRAAPAPPCLACSRLSVGAAATYSLPPPRRLPCPQDCPESRAESRACGGVCARWTAAEPRPLGLGMLQSPILPAARMPPQPRGWT